MGVDAVTFSLANGQPVSQGIRTLLERALAFGVMHSRPSWVIMNAVRQHVQQKYPGSEHWNPSKVVEVGSRGNRWNVEGEAEVQVPGAGRAYHDVEIYPVNGQWLAIPLLPQSKGTSPRDWSGLFRPKNKNVLAKKDGSGLSFVFALSKHVHQDQDPTLMPSDDSLARAVGDRFVRLAAEELDRRLAAVNS